MTLGELKKILNKTNELDHLEIQVSIVDADGWSGTQEEISEIRLDGNIIYLGNDNNGISLL